METLIHAWEWLKAALATPAFYLGESPVTFGSILYVILAFIGLVLVSGWIRKLLVQRVLKSRGVDIGVRQAIGTLVRYSILLIGGMVIIQSTGIDLTTLNVLAGAVGLGVGFGLQTIANNFISGLIILFERPIKVGDRIVVGEVAGDVTKISPRATTVVTNDNIAVIVPNADFISNLVTNWSYTDRNVRFNIPVGVSYGSDPEKVRQCLVDVAMAHPGVLRSPVPETLLVEFGDSSLNFLLRVWTHDYINRPLILQSELNYAIFKAFRDRGIEIPFPQRDLHIRSGLDKFKM